MFTLDVAAAICFCALKGPPREIWKVLKKYGEHFSLANSFLLYQESDKENEVHMKAHIELKNISCGNCGILHLN